MALKVFVVLPTEDYMYSKALIRKRHSHHGSHSLMVEYPMVAIFDGGKFHKNKGYPFREKSIT